MLNGVSVLESLCLYALVRGIGIECMFHGILAQKCYRSAECLNRFIQSRKRCPAKFYLKDNFRCFEARLIFFYCRVLNNTLKRLQRLMFHYYSSLALHVLFTV